jgi:hypothetical protein
MPASNPSSQPDGRLPTVVPGNRNRMRFGDELLAVEQAHLEVGKSV